MPKKSPKSQAQPRPRTIWIAPVLVVAGAIGLVWALTSTQNATQSSTNNSSQLQVQPGGNGNTEQSQSQAGGQLQGAASVNDLIQGQDGNNLQQGTAAETLTKDVELQ